MNVHLHTVLPGPSRFGCISFLYRGRILSVNDIPGDDEDIRLVRQTLNGKPEAFRALMRKYEKPVYYFCFSYTKKAEEAEDAAQDVFLRAFVSLKTFSLDKRFKIWIFAVAANVLRSRWKKAFFYREKLKRLFLTVRERPAGDIAEDAYRNLRGGAVRKAVSGLPESLRICVYFYYFEGFSVEEIAKALELGEEAVKSRLHRARRILRKKLEYLEP
jgi:RNA polymerase sigma-70 factor (ECF subfamily)